MVRGHLWGRRLPLEGSWFKRLKNIASHLKLATLSHVSKHNSLHRKHWNLTMIKTMKTNRGCCRNQNLELASWTHFQVIHFKSLTYQSNPGGWRTRTFAINVWLWALRLFPHTLDGVIQTIMLIWGTHWQQTKEELTQWKTQQRRDRQTHLGQWHQGFKRLKSPGQSGKWLIDDIFYYFYNLSLFY